MDAGTAPPAFTAPIRKPANFGSRCRLAAPLRRATRGRGVFLAVGRLRARIGPLTVSRSALSRARGVRDEMPVRQRRQVCVGGCERSSTAPSRLKQSRPRRGCFAGPPAAPPLAVAPMPLSEASARQGRRDLALPVGSEGPGVRLRWGRAQACSAAASMLWLLIASAGRHRRECCPGQE